MRATWRLLPGLGAVLICLAGCQTTPTKFHPPKQPETYTLPPEDDPRFSSAPTYPKNTLNQDYIKRDKERTENADSGQPKGHFGGAGSGPNGY